MDETTSQKSERGWGDKADETGAGSYIGSDAAQQQLLFLRCHLRRRLAASAAAAEPQSANCMRIGLPYQ